MGEGADGHVVHPASCHRADVAEVEAAGRLDLGPLRGRGCTASAVSANDMLSTRTRSAPAASASSSSARSSTSTSSVRPPRAAAPGDLAASTAAFTPPRAAMWLSFTRRAYDRFIRWLQAPPQRTAYFSTARRPGKVLRVSLTTAPVPATASTIAGRQRGHPGEMREDVEQGALRSQQSVRRAADDARRQPRGELGPRRP